MLNNPCGARLIKMHGQNTSQLSDFDYRTKSLVSEPIHELNRFKRQNEAVDKLMRTIRHFHLSSLTIGLNTTLLCRPNNTMVGRYSSLTTSLFCFVFCLCVGVFVYLFCLFTRSLRTETHFGSNGTRIEQNTQARLQKPM